MVRADHLYAADSHWWQYHIADIARDFEGKCWTCETDGKTNWGKVDPMAWGITALACRVHEDDGLSCDPAMVHSGGNSGYQAINLAYLLDATRIILIGFDMHNHSGKSHWFGDHPKAFANSNQDANRYIGAFRTIKPADYGIEILNCSRVTALDAFPRHDLEDVF